MNRLSHLVLLALLASSLRASAGELKIPDVPDGKIDNLVVVPAPPAATCAAISDVANVLAIGHKLGTEPHLTLVALDAAGQPTAAAPIAVMLPRLPPPVRRNYPLSLAFHPKLPLLYVWQDVEAEKPYAPPDAVTRDFDHLLVYNVSKLPPVLVQGFARGPDFATNNRAGAIGLNLTGNRLYVPNMFAEPGKQPEYSGLGYFKLDAAGMPVNVDAKPGPVSVAGRSLPGNWALSGTPCGLGFVALEKDIVITGGYTGPVTWNEHNPRAPFNSLIVHTFTHAYYVDRFAGHHRLPVLYACAVGSGHLGRIEHVDGYPTLTPQRALLERATIHSPPIVISKRNQIAFGGEGKVHVIELDDKGYYTTKRSQAAVNNPAAAAVVYSEKFDRLYVAVEKTK